MKRGMLAPAAARNSTLKFFGNLFSRRFSDAERAIQELSEKKFNESQFKKGYIQALEGILVSNRSGDEREFYNKINFDSSEIKKYKNEFKNFTVNNFHSEFDKGFFSAWYDLMIYQDNSEENS
jgi:hypothetical protein